MRFLDGLRSLFSAAGGGPGPEPASIYAHIEAHLPEQGPGLLEGGDTLPDDALVRSASGLGWAPGALDGAFSRHAGGEVDPSDRVDALCSVLARLARRPGRQTRRAVVRAFRDGDARALLHPLLTRLAEEMPPARQQVFYREMRSLVLKTGHREALKFALGILSGFGNPDDLDLVLTVARHEEFTFIAAGALANLAEEPWPHWLEMAKSVTGWGRIELIELLLAEGEPAPEVCDFLLREGASNDIMNEYTALPIATRCRLHQALDENPDDPRLAGGASVVLAALALEEAGEGPGAGGMLDYSESGVATERLVARLAVEAMTLADYLAVDSIRRFVEEDHEVEALERCGWTPDRRKSIRASLRRVLADPVWPERARTGLASRDDATHHRALAVARSLGLPLHEHLRGRLEREPLSGPLWFEHLRDPTAEEMDETLEMAERLVDLDRIATGAANELGLGSGYELHGVADSLLQALQVFPGKGWWVVRPALRSPVVRNRNLALAVLERWPLEAFTEEIRATLESCADDPDEQVAGRAAALLERFSQGGS